MKHQTPALSRRRFMKLATSSACCAALARVGAWTIFPEGAWAKGPLGTKKLVVIDLAGGNDGLMTLAPTGDSYFMDKYMQARPTLSIPLQPRLPLSGTLHSVHSALPEFANTFQMGQLAVVQKCGIVQNSSRSHDEARLAFARGLVDDDGGQNNITGEAAGWLQRAALAAFTDSQEIIDFSGGSPFTGGGSFPVMTISNLASLQPPVPPQFPPNVTIGRWDGVHPFYHAILDIVAGIPVSGLTEQQRRVHQSWSLSSGAFGDLQEVLDSVAISQPFPTAGPGAALKDIFRSFRALPTRIAYLSQGGFDLHSNAEPSGSAPESQRALYASLNSGLSAFRANCQAAGIWSDVIVLIVSEFGRGCRENGSRGTDHGNGNNVYLLGGSIRGGLYGDTPHGDELLHPSNALTTTTSVIQVYYEAIQALGINPDLVFPGYVPQPLSLIGA